MAADDKLPDLLVLGVHKKIEAYPNTLFRLQDLAACNAFNILEINHPIGFQGNIVKKSSLATVFNVVKAHALVISDYLRYGRHAERAYIPHPTVFVLFLLSWMPRKMRPQWIVADVFISLYDTVVHDRQTFKASSIPAKLLHWVERRAYGIANRLIVDTAQNKDYLIQEFGLPHEKVIPIPLSTNEQAFTPTPYTPRPDICRVLFVGTLVPLHGIETIAGAARLLADHNKIQFKIIGDGQDGEKLSNLIAGLDNVQWDKGWKTNTELAEEIRNADICLGIFGTSDKTQRVCPLKIYAYAAIGRAIITGDTHWYRDMQALTTSPMLAIPAGQPIELSQMILLLTHDPEARARLSATAAEFYREKLANNLATEQLINTLTLGINTCLGERST